MSPFELTLLWFAWVIGAGSPGPATLSIAGTSMTTGRKAGVIFSLGITSGSAFWGLTAALGLSAIMVSNAWLFDIVKYIGAGYLLYLATKSLRSALSAKSEMAQRAYGGSARQIFAKGALIHLTNPKAVLGWGSVFAIVMPVDATTFDLVKLFLFLFSGSMFVFISYAFIFSTGQMVAVYKRMQRGFELTFATFFGFASLKILTARLP